MVDERPPKKVKGYIRHRGNKPGYVPKYRRKERNRDRATVAAAAALPQLGAIGKTSPKLNSLNTFETASSAVSALKPGDVILTGFDKGDAVLSGAYGGGGGHAHGFHASIVKELVDGVPVVYDFGPGDSFTKKSLEISADAPITIVRPKNGTEILKRAEAMHVHTNKVYAELVANGVPPMSAARATTVPYKHNKITALVLYEFFVPSVRSRSTPAKAFTELGDPKKVAKELMADLARGGELRHPFLKRGGICTSVLADMGLSVKGIPSIAGPGAILRGSGNELVGVFKGGAKQTRIAKVLPHAARGLAGLALGAVTAGGIAARRSGDRRAVSKYHKYVSKMRGPDGGWRYKYPKLRKTAAEDSSRVSLGRGIAALVIGGTPVGMVENAALHSGYTAAVAAAEREPVMSFQEGREALKKLNPGAYLIESSNPKAAAAVSMKGSVIEMALKHDDPALLNHLAFKLGASPDDLRAAANAPNGAVIMGKDMMRKSILAHEATHAEIATSKLLSNLAHVGGLMKAGKSFPMIAAATNSDNAASNNAVAAQAVLQAPILIEEGRANIGAYRKLRRGGYSSLRRVPKTLGAAYSTYAAGALGAVAATAGIRAVRRKMDTGSFAGKPKKPHKYISKEKDLKGSWRYKYKKMFKTAGAPPLQARTMRCFLKK